MPIITDNKRPVGVILSKMKDGVEKSGSFSPEHDLVDSTPLHVIAEDMLMAFQSKSKLDLVEALKALIAEIEARDEEQDESMG